jgi:hypothetical protein
MEHEPIWIGAHFFRKHAIWEDFRRTIWLEAGQHMLSPQYLGHAEKRHDVSVLATPVPKRVVFSIAFVALPRDEACRVALTPFRIMFDSTPGSLSDNGPPQAMQVQYVPPEDIPGKEFSCTLAQVCFEKILLGDQING